MMGGECFPCGSVVKNLSTKAGDVGSVPDLGRSPGEENGNPLLLSCLGNPMDREPDGVHEVTKSRTQLSGCLLGDHPLNQIMTVI